MHSFLGAIALVVSALIVSIASVSQAQLGEKSHAQFPPDIRRILDRGSIIVSMTSFDRPPFVMRNQNNREYGFEIDLANEIAESLGVKLVLLREGKTFDEVIDTVIDGRADMVLSKISMTNERAKKVRFTMPYLVLRHAFLVNRLKFTQAARGREPAEYIQHFDGPLAVIEGSSYSKFAKQYFPKAQIKEYKTWEPDIVDAVAKGEVTAAYRDEFEIKRLMASNPDRALHLRTVLFTDTKDEIGMAVPWNSTHLLAWLNYFLSNKRLNLTPKTLIEKYFQDNDKVNK